MVPDIGEIIALGLLIIFGMVAAVPLLGMMVGAIAGRFTPRVSAGLGAVIGFASGVLGIGATILVLGMFEPYKLASLDERNVVTIGPSLVGLVAPIVLLQLIRMQRGRGN